MPSAFPPNAVSYPNYIGSVYISVLDLYNDPTQTVLLHHSYLLRPGGRAHL